VTVANIPAVGDFSRYL